MAGQNDVLGPVVIRRRAELLGLLVGQAGAVVIGDVPVDLAQVALVVQVDAGGTVDARLQAQRVGDADGLVDLGLGYIAVGQAVGRGLAAEVQIGRGSCRGRVCQYV